MRNPYIQPDRKTGRLMYRRAFPAALQPFLERPRIELKVSLGTNDLRDPKAEKKRLAAERQYDEEMRKAEAARRVAELEAVGKVDRLTPELIAYLVGEWAVDGLAIDEEVRWAPQPLERKQERQARLRESTTEDLNEALALRGLGDLEGILARWGAPAAEHAAGYGYNVDLETGGFSEYVRSFHDTLIECWQVVLRRLNGETVPTPPVPQRPKVEAGVNSPSAGSQRTVSVVIDAYKEEKREKWSQSTRSAVEPVFRVLRDTIGDEEITEVDREKARKVFGIVKALPVALGRQKALAGLKVPEAVEEAKRLGLPVLDPNTVNRGYMVHIAAVFNFARKEQWIVASPFEGLRAHDPVPDDEKRDPFSDEQLILLFKSGPWAHRDESRPGRFWVPLLCAFHGLRLAEASGLLVEHVTEREGIPVLLLRAYKERGMKTTSSRGVLPVHPELIRLGFVDYVNARRGAGQRSLFEDVKANTNGKMGAKLGEWFSQHVDQLGMIGRKLGMHSFRHSFEDRLREAELPERTALALGRRAEAGSSGGYGRGLSIKSLERAQVKVVYPGLDLSHLKP